jgi:hypothetical protein
MSELHDLLELPESVVKSAFVVQLTEGVRHPEEMLRDYAVTADLQRAFDQALALVKSSIDGRRSVAAYVHGSFGSGKSHFMSVLSLMLSPDPADQAFAWKEQELQGLRTRHGWLAEKKVLRLHLHMIGASSLEAKVFPEYLARTRERFPDAVLPALFADEGLFANARDLRSQLGDETFFTKLNGGRKADPRWGNRAPGSLWTDERFERAMATTEPDERQKLFDALVRTHFTAFLGTTHGFVDLDRGLGELSRHARSLGFDAVVFFFDEAVLWLANGASDRAWVTREMSKLAKMVEAQDANRPAPLVSFLARQRDIVELVGDQLAGGDLQALREAQRFWEGRFGTVPLPDRNLPAIVRKRVVRPKDGAAAKRLDDAFDAMRRKLGSTAWQTLLGDIGEGEDAFRAVYPFSPALIQVLVGMSAALQRERTALKVLMEILVEHLKDFELGRLVAVGDLFDVLAGGEEPMDGVLREQFQTMRTAYQSEYLPLVQITNKTNTAEKCQRLRDDHPPQIGCSGCPETRCRADNRVLKTLLLATLLPNVSVLKDLTASRVVALNHGTLRSTIPGNEAATVVSRLREYASQVGTLRVGDQKDPLVLVELTNVDLRPVIESAREHDKPGARKVKLRALLFTAFGHTGWETTEFSLPVDWRGTSRSGVVLFGNVRELDESRFRVATGHDFRILIDYPFDEPTHTPQEDEARVIALRDHLDERTVVWLPDFFSDAVQADLGMLVVLDAILAGDAWKSYLSHLRADDQQRARQSLDSLRSQKQNRVLRAIESAYGITGAGAGMLDPDRTVTEHFHVLLPDRKIPNLTVTRLSDAPDALASALLAECYPRHPKFPSKVGRSALGNALKLLARLAETAGRQMSIDRADRRDAEVCAALNLVVLREADVVLREEPFAELERDLRTRGVDVGRIVTVEAVRSVLDPRKVKGFTREVEDFVILAWAASTNREVSRGDRLFDEAPIGALPDEAELVLPKLPSAESWERALTRASVCLGLPRGPSALRSRNVRRLADEIERARALAVESGALQLPSLLDARLSLLDERAPRVATAGEMLRLVKSLEVRDPVARVEALTGFASSVSDAALGKCMESMRAVTAALSDRLLWQGVESITRLEDADAIELVARVRKVLSADEGHESLARELPRFREEVGRILTREQGPPPPAPPPPPGPRPPFGGDPQKSLGGTASSVREARDALTAMRAELDEIERSGGRVELIWSLKRS